MSGGHFDCQQYRLHDIAQQIAELIDSNDDATPNRWGEHTGRGYGPATIKLFEQAVTLLRLAEVHVQRIDWLVSGDDSEESFHRRLLADLEALKAEAAKGST